MLRAAIIFFALGLVSLVFGMTGFAGVSIVVGKMLLSVFLLLAVVTFVINLISGSDRRQLPH